jgi:hypothetical protein
MAEGRRNKKKNKRFTHYPMPPAVRKVYLGKTGTIMAKKNVKRTFLIRSYKLLDDFISFSC